MQLAVVRTAQRDREFVADLEAETAGLRKPQMVRVTGLAAADEAGLFRNEPQMLLVPQPSGFWEGQHAFVDAGAELVLCSRRVQFGWLVVALALTAIITAVIIYDGESTWVEGLALVGLYALIAAAFWWG